MNLRNGAEPAGSDYDGVLDQWWIYSDELGGDLVYALVGMILADKKGRFPDGRWIRTSKLTTLVSLLKEETVVETRNSSYLLGTRFPYLRVHGVTNTIGLRHTPLDEENRLFGAIGDDDEEAKKLLRTKFRVCAAVGDKSERAALAPRECSSVVICGRRSSS